MSANKLGSPLLRSVPLLLEVVVKELGYQHLPQSNLLTRVPYKTVQWNTRPNSALTPVDTVITILSVNVVVERMNHYDSAKRYFLLLPQQRVLLLQMQSNHNPISALNVDYLLL